MTDNRTEALEHEIDKLRTHNQALTNAFDRAERQLAQARIDAGGMRPHPSIYSSPICGQPHPRNDWRCTLAEGHTGPHSVSLTAYWEPMLERDVIEGEPQNGYTPTPSTNSSPKSHR